MMFDMIFGFFIGVTGLILMFFVIHVFLKTIKLVKAGENVQINLKERLMAEEKKQKIYAEHILLVTTLEQTLFNRFFEINKQLILLHKILFKY